MTVLLLDKVRVKLKKAVDYSYDVEIEQGSFDSIAKTVAKMHATKCAVITDDNVYKLYGARLIANLGAEGVPASLLSFPAGEQSKNLNTYSRLCSQAVDLGLDRKSLIIALGGGVVGDLAGFVAATYMRGIAFIQVPTTLLAMVDSSVGGKVGVDAPQGKNLLGAFWQPKKVFIDPLVLATLPQGEIKNGFAEAVKTACIADAKLFGFLEKNCEKILSSEPKAVQAAVKRCCEIKASVVEKDEREGEWRKMLNYGHTIGHALEAETNYSKYKHGEAVAIGMAAAARISHALKLMPSQDVERQSALLQKAGLPTSIPRKISAQRLYEHAARDKKNEGGQVQFVLLDKIGTVHAKGGKVGAAVDKRVVQNALK